MNPKTNPSDDGAEPLGDTGDGDTGVPEFEQGISNRPGDKDPERDDDNGKVDL
jgi:hypothetical protein